MKIFKCCLTMLGIFIGPQLVHSGVLNQTGKSVLGKNIEYCFVGNATTNNPSRIMEIQNFMTEYTNAVNVNFIYKGKCPAPTILNNGNENYGNMHRLNITGSDIPKTATIPGIGCTANWPNSSFSMFPQEAADNFSCLFTSVIGDDSDPTTGMHYRNHTLHELGHALGLGHEHRRTDAPVDLCNEPGFGPDATESISGTFITPYDFGSVMNYYFPTCGIFGNYSQSGLSVLDVVSLRVLYPENGNIASTSGTTNVRMNQIIKLTAGPSIHGAREEITQTAKWLLYEIDNPSHIIIGVGTHVSLQAPNGRYIGSVIYKDLLNRTFAKIFKVNVLDKQEYLAEVLTAPISFSANF